MTSIQVLTGPLDDERRGEALFGGDLLISKDVAPLRRFSRLVGELVRAMFGDAPQHAQFDLSPEEFTARANHLVDSCRRHPAALQGFRKALRHVGVDLDRTYWNWLHLRTLVPRPCEPVNADSEVRIVIEPGDLLCFSGAHLHASAPDTSGATRFSVEVRTVAGIDVQAGRGARNVDAEAPWVAWRWFRGITSSASLADLAEPQS